MAGKTRVLEIWQALNDRQQGVLAVIYELDQAKEKGRPRWDDTPAAVWRRIDFALDHSLSQAPPTTAMQDRLAAGGWHNQGNGSTISALANRGLVTRGYRSTPMGTMITVAMTREGRAVARAALSLPAGSGAALSVRSWEVLVLLWVAHRNGTTLAWGHSTTIEKVLIGRHVPPLACRVVGGRGYEITDRGLQFYREHHAAHAAAHPGVRAPHPDGAAAEPWPRRADTLLAAHRTRYEALADAWTMACADRDAAETEAAQEAPEPPAGLPTELAEQIEARHRLWVGTARERAEEAAAHVAELADHTEHAARAFAAAALTAHRAAVRRTDPLERLTGPSPVGDTWDEPPLDPPAPTGIHVIDAEAAKLHAAAVGRPYRRRGPAPKQPRRRGTTRHTAPPPPGSDCAALGRFLSEHLAGGTLTRRLHPDAYKTAPQSATTPEGPAAASGGR
ncbi:hypothetical protein [Streptomyces sp. NPDC097619]|uniref:hypothetical protein n=1 Tax=Streptomyces sp. NPDC097619 TaxID=3157228 RepID=UPI003322148F